MPPTPPTIRAPCKCCQGVEYRKNGFRLKRNKANPRVPIRVQLYQCLKCGMIQRGEEIKESGKE